MDVAPWIADYAAYLESSGYVGKTIRVRLQHLDCLARFIEVRGLKALEEFGPQLASEFIDYWVHQPMGKNSRGWKRKSRFEPHHHRDVQSSLRCFLRWAHATGRIQRNVFPLTPVADGFFFPETADYLLFCEQHKGLAKATLAKAELFLRRFEQFLRSVPLTAWDQLQSSHIDLFVRQQASHNVERIQDIHAVLRGLFRYLFSVGCVDRDWASALISPRRYFLARTPRAIPSEQVLRLLQSIDRERHGGKRDFATASKDGWIDAPDSLLKTETSGKRLWQHRSCASHPRYNEDRTVLPASTIEIFLVQRPQKSRDFKIPNLSVIQCGLPLSQ